jgi:hypothetical protein
MANQSMGMKILRLLLVTGAVNGGDTINYTLATTALNSLMLRLSYL